MRCCRTRRAERRAGDRRPLAVALHRSDDVCHRRRLPRVPLVHAHLSHQPLPGHRHRPARGPRRRQPPAPRRRLHARVRLRRLAIRPAAAPVSLRRAQPGRAGRAGVRRGLRAHRRRPARRVQPSLRPAVAHPRHRLLQPPALRHRRLARSAAGERRRAQAVFDQHVLGVLARRRRTGAHRSRRPEPTSRPIPTPVPICCPAPTTSARSPSRT